jgi:hypothetical protein
MFWLGLHLWLDNSLISKNNIRESENGLLVDSESNANRIESNDVLGNKVDLNNANGLATNVNQNGYSNNNCEISNPSGLCTLQLMLCNHHKPVHNNLLLRSKSRRARIRLYRKKKNNLYHSSLSLETMKTQLRFGIFNRIMSRFSTLDLEQGSNKEIFIINSLILDRR